MNDTDKVVIHSVDIQTSLLFKKNEKSKFRQWLKAHPNFIFQKSDGRWVHRYEPEYIQWQHQMDEQRAKEAEQVTEEQEDNNNA